MDSHDRSWTHGYGPVAGLGQRLVLQRMGMVGGLLVAIGLVQLATRYRKLPAAIRIATLPRVGEVMQNVIRHAQAGDVRFNVRRDWSDLVLAVEDDGCGLAQPPRNGRGLHNLQARMQALGGSFSITPRAQAPGTNVMLRVARI